MEDDKHIRAVFNDAANKLEVYDKELRTARKREGTWKKLANRTQRELSKYKGKTKARSVRTISGGLPGLGKNRKN